MISFAPQLHPSTTRDALAAALDPDNIVSRMADSMRELRGAGRAVTAENLIAFDFTDEEIDANLRAASNLARQRWAKELRS